MQTQEYWKIVIRGGHKKKLQMKAPKQQLFNAKRQKLKRQMLRNNATPAEKRLWSYLRNSQLLGRKFRRQQGIGPYIVDFYCPKEKLAVELDGEIHSTSEARQYDQERDTFIHDHGIITIRFRNEEVFNDIDSVLQTIAKHFRTSSAVS
jgi:very-short-patch-repair endonuclease